MSVNGACFLLFLLCAAVLHRIFPRRFRWTVLLAASAVFYALSGGWRASLWLVGATVFTYLCSLALGRLAARPATGGTPEEKRKSKRSLKLKKRALLAFALAADFSLLGVMKYSAFFAAVISSVSGRTIAAPGFVIPLLGVSFYVFQTAAYLVDVQKGKYPPQKNPLKYALFVCWFPQMVQGPINRYAAISGGLYDGDIPDLDKVRRGIVRMMFGIMKKALIADALAPAVSTIYGGYADMSGGVIFCGAALYCLQLYCDFSGGIDLLCGASSLFGADMHENFRRPYFSTSLDDFWRRWHISLGEWMKDYLFYPFALSKPMGKLAKTAKKRLPAEIAKRVVPCIATFVVFIAVGIWQGPGWQNIAYGLWNGTLMSAGMLCAPLFIKLRSRAGKKGRAALLVWGVIRTDLLVVAGRYFSNSGSLRQALGMFRRTLTFAPATEAGRAALSALEIDAFTVVRIAAACAALFLISLAREKGIDVAGAFFRRKWYVQFALLTFCLAVIVIGVYANTDYTPIAYVYENV